MRTSHRILSIVDTAKLSSRATKAEHLAATARAATRVPIATADAPALVVAEAIAAAAAVVVADANSTGPCGIKSPEFGFDGGC